MDAFTGNHRHYAFKYVKWTNSNYNCPLSLLLHSMDSCSPQYIHSSHASVAEDNKVVKSQLLNCDEAFNPS